MVQKIVQAIGKELRKYLEFNVCPMTLSLSTWLKIAVASIILALGGYCYVLQGENKALKTINTEQTKWLEAKTDALTLCTESTEALEKREKEITENAKKAVEEAKKEAVKDYKAANSYLFAKPKVPVITKDNEQDFGGNDTMVQMKDYLATHQLVNEFIEFEVKK